MIGTGEEDRPDLVVMLMIDGSGADVVREVACRMKSLRKTLVMFGVISLTPSPHGKEPELLMVLVVFSP